MDSVRRPQASCKQPCATLADMSEPTQAWQRLLLRCEPQSSRAPPWTLVPMLYATGSRFLSARVSDMQSLFFMAKAMCVTVRRGWQSRLSGLGCCQRGCRQQPKVFSSDQVSQWLGHALDAPPLGASHSLATD